MSGTTIKAVLEDVCDNLFNPDPYYQQGGDMVRVGGLQYTCTPAAKSGARINDMTLNGRAVEADKIYLVAGWAPVAEGVKGEPIWNVMESYFKDNPVITPRKLNQPRLIGTAGNPGVGA
jgi:sulfur-oxidizing protein SoxB